MSSARALSSAVGLVGALALPSIALAQPKTTADPVDRLFQPWAAATTPGCAVGVSQGGRMVVSRAYGAADLDHGVANTPETVFEAGSASKQFTAAAILLLVKDGKLALSDDIRKHLPEMPNYGTPITIDHLLHHTSGLRDWRYVAGVGGDLPGEHAHSNADALALAVRQRGLNHAPGAEYSYTNTGYTLLAVIVERVSGQSLAAFSRSRIFQPLGMASTQWRDDFRRVVKTRARAYTRSGDAYAENMPFESAYGAGGLLTTVGDLLIWNAALDAGRLGPGVTTGLQEPGRLGDGGELPYARGLFVGRHNGALEFGHGGVTGGYRAWVGRYPEHRLSIAILCNSDAAPESFGREIATRYLPAASNTSAAIAQNSEASDLPRREPAPGPVRPRWRPTTSELASFTGRYASEEVDGTYVATLEGDRLVMRLQGRASAPLILSPTYQDSFLFEGGRVRFQRATGEAPTFTIDVQRAEGLLFRRLAPPMSR